MKTNISSLFVVFAMSSRALFAATDTWNGTTGDMNTAGNWNPAAVPTTGDTLVFPTLPSGTSPTYIYVLGNDMPGSSFPIPTVQITSISNPYTLGGSTFTFSAGGTLSTVGSHTISMPLALNGSFIVTSSSSAVTISGGISGGAGTLELTSGQLILSGGNSFAGTIAGAPSPGTAAIKIDGGNSPAAVLSATVSSAIPSGGVWNNGTLALTPATLQSGGQVIVGTGIVQMNGSATWNITNTTNTYSGGTAITAGTLGVVGTGSVGTGSISLGAGTLLLNSGGSYDFPIILRGAGTISTSSNATYTAIISDLPVGSGSLTVIAAGGSLAFGSTSVNTYGGGTILTSGTLAIVQQSNLGTGNLKMGGTGTPILQINAGISNFSVPIVLTGAATIDITTGSVTITKPITGMGPLTLAVDNATQLVLSSSGGSNTYSGGTTISGSGGVISGDTKSLQGNITFSSSTVGLVFDQTVSGTAIGNGTYSGSLSGPSGVGTITKNNAGTVTFSGNSNSFSGSTSITGGTLNITGSLSSSFVTVVGGSLTGSGSVNGVLVSPGSTLGPNGVNTFSVNGTTGANAGTVQFDENSVFAVNISPNGISDLLKVTNGVTIANTATLPIVYVYPEAAFYGLNSTYTILTASSITNTFGSVQSSEPGNFMFTISYPGANTVELGLTVVEPFLFFPTENANEQSVANYINKLGAEGVLLSNAALVNVIDSLAGQSFAVINNALDQMHPAIFSAFGELQADLGGQLISLFHRRPGPTCCSKPWRVWVEPYGNWLVEKNTGMQIGFDARSLGLAFGVDWELLENLVIGVGGAGNHTDLLWKSNRGHADINGYYAAAYVDYTYRFLYFGGSVLLGGDHYNTTRKLKFSSINETAVGEHGAVDFITQFSCGMFFGPQACCFYPFINVDYMVLDQLSFKESGAPALNLDIESFNGQTIRTELGLGLQVQDTNYKETMCISPRVSLGYTAEIPVAREKITSSFEGETLTFKVQGWDYTWQLFTFTLGLDLSYKCFTLGGEYTGEINGNDSFWGQRANINARWSW